MTHYKKNVEKFIEDSPSWLKAAYIAFMRFVRWLLAMTGLLLKLDRLSQGSQRFHYLRSLLAIHHLDDMVFLDTPWWTYEAIQALQMHIHQLGYKPVIFEYGSGASTIWLAKRAAKVISVEHDMGWYHQLKDKIPQQVELLLKEAENGPSTSYGSHKAPNLNFKSYVQAIKETNQIFDVIIIDGRSREACLKACLPYLKQDGIIIFDNSNRKRYQQALLTSGLVIERFYGCVPGSPFKSETALLKKAR
ncbi:MAG: class I SAM-dependent methyltransferase [Proteobacteria bacterium]|nr:class I SAM-dependent methyltransferase [Pseudomonadota bacterium]